MANDTTITVRGRAGTTPRMMGEDGYWTTFRLATSSRFRTREGEWRDGPTTWFSVHANGDLAVRVAQTVRSGVGLVVRGRISTDRYLTRAGDPREQLKLVADAIGLDILQSGIVVWHPAKPPTDVSGLETARDGVGGDVDDGPEDSVDDDAGGPDHDDDGGGDDEASDDDGGDDELSDDQASDDDGSTYGRDCNDAGDAGDDGLMVGLPAALEPGF